LILKYGGMIVNLRVPRPFIRKPELPWFRIRPVGALLAVIFIFVYTWSLLAAGWSACSEVETIANQLALQMQVRYQQYSVHQDQGILTMNAQEQIITTEREGLFSVSQSGNRLSKCHTDK